MSVMHIQIPDDLKEAFEKAFPGEAVDTFLARMMREALSKRSEIEAKPRESLVEMAKKLASSMPPTTDEEIRRLREEGRP